METIKEFRDRITSNADRNAIQLPTHPLTGYNLRQIVAFVSTTLYEVYSLKCEVEKLKQEDAMETKDEFNERIKKGTREYAFQEVDFKKHTRDDGHKLAINASFKALRDEIYSLKCEVEKLKLEVKGND